MCSSCSFWPGKGLVINATRLRRIEEIFITDDTEHFINKGVLLRPAKQNGRHTIFISGVPESDPI